MADHASDCALHNAPALPPGACSCGASPLFKFFAYSVMTDEFRWTTHSRESFVSSLVGAAIGALYRDQTGISRHVLIRRAVTDGFIPAEQDAVDQAWDGAVVPDPVWLESKGMLDSLVSVDLSPLDAELRKAIALKPTIEEIREAMAPWFDHWASLPAPSRLRAA